MADFCMPSLGADMMEGTLIKWMVKPGDRVKRGDIIAEVETDKADLEIEVFETGLVDRFLVEEGTCVPVGTPIAVIDTGVGWAATTKAPAITSHTAETRTPAPSVTAPAPAPAEVPPAEAPPRKSPARPQRVRATPTARVLASKLGLDLKTVTGSGIGGDILRADVERAAAAKSAAPLAGRPRISPRARRMATELGVSIEDLQGTGPDGSITGDDVQRATPTASPAAATPTSPVPASRPSGRRGPIAALMERSNREIPHYYLSQDIDVSATLDWLSRENAARPITDRILFPALLIKAVAIAAREVPELNGYWLDGAFAPADAVNVGFAVSLRGGGLVAPALANPDQEPLVEVMRQLRDLVNRARTGKLRASEVTGGTITITSLGETGVDEVLGVIFPPQVALVGSGRIRERPWAESGMLTVRQVITVTLAADHRANDGHRGGLFLQAIERALKEPATL